MAADPKAKPHRLSISPSYLALICCLIILLLIIGGYFELNRTRKSLKGILEKQGLTLLQGLEREIQSTVSVIDIIEEVPGSHLLNISLSIDFFALEDAIIDHLVEIALLVDRQALSESQLERLVRSERVTAIEVLNADSRSRVLGGDLSRYEPLLRGDREVLVLPFEKPRPDDDDRFSVALRRARGRGATVVSVDYHRMKELRRMFAIRNILETMGFGEGVEYVSVLDSSLSLIAHTGIEEGGEERNPSSLQREDSIHRVRSLRSGQEVLEVAKTLHLGGKPHGIMRVGLSTQGIRSILGLSRRNIIVSIGVLLVLGIAGVTLIYIDQNRHLRKVEEMEDRVRTAERLLALGKLGAGVAHEIRNPLNAIGMAVQRLGREFRPREGGEGEYHEIIRVIREEIQRVNHIVEQFVRFSRPSRLEFILASPAEIVENVSILFGEEARGQSIEMHKEMDPQLPPVMMDKEKITQALINIVTNSIQAMEEGGSLTLRGELDGRDWIKITISDTGKGIPEGEIEKALEYTYTTKEKGLGLGLPIAHKIIEEHGGRMTIESTVGTGTAVSLFLPVKGVPRKGEDEHTADKRAGRGG
jgi:signal transduction histidine kinase